MFVTLLLFAFLFAHNDPFPKFVVPNVPDLTIKTRTTTTGDPIGRTETLYLKGARQRHEALGMTIITQCDVRREIILNDALKLYAPVPIADLREGLQEARRERTRLSSSTATTAAGLLTIDAHDTGERRQMGRYVARHVVTTTTFAPPLSSPASVVEQDGWYIDVPPRNCWDVGDHAVAAFLGGTMLTARDAAQRAVHADRVRLERRGTGQAGYPVEEFERNKFDKFTVEKRVELLEFSEGPLDASLFTIPTGYRRALENVYGGFDLTRPDSVSNRLGVYWQAISSWVQNLFR